MEPKSTIPAPGDLGSHHSIRLLLWLKWAVFLNWTFSSSCCWARTTWRLIPIAEQNLGRSALWWSEPDIINTITFPGWRKPVSVSSYWNLYNTGRLHDSDSQGYLGATNVGELNSRFHCQGQFKLLAQVSLGQSIYSGIQKDNSASLSHAPTSVTTLWKCSRSNSRC